MDEKPRHGVLDYKKDTRVDEAPIAEVLTQYFELLKGHAKLAVGKKSKKETPKAKQAQENKGKGKEAKGSVKPKGKGQETSVPS